MNNTEDKVDIYGKVAKFNVKKQKITPHYASEFLSNNKITKDKIWYIMIETDEQNSIQTVKYNKNADIKLKPFLIDLKTFYYSKFPDLIDEISNIDIKGDDNFSKIVNIPDIMIGDTKFISILIVDILKFFNE